MNASQSIKRKVESVMRREEKAPFLSLASALYAVSLFYGAGLRLRALGYRRKILPTHQLPCRVICVGNITLGGTGKTPMTMHLAQEIKQLGLKAAVVSRGYRGGAESQGGIVSDGKSIQMGPQLAGDEPYMMARALGGIPVVVGKNRFAAGRLAYEKFRPDVIVLDDGFQHLRLKRDCDIVLLDYSRPFGNAHLLPRGGLREPVSALVRSHACILTRCPSEGSDNATAAMETVKKYAPQIPFFTSTHEIYYYKVKSGERIPAGGEADRQPGPASDGSIIKPTFGFSGIARNLDFQDTVASLGFNAQGFLEYSDHHQYTGKDLHNIQSQAEKTGSRQLITTEKDLVRLSPHNPFSMDLVAVGVRVSFGIDQQKFLSFIQRTLNLEPTK